MKIYEMEMISTHETINSIHEEKGQVVLLLNSDTQTKKQTQLTTFGILYVFICYRFQLFLK